MQSAYCGRCMQMLPFSHNRPPLVVSYRQPGQPQRRPVSLQPATHLTGWPTCSRQCGAPAAAPQAVSTAADAELPSAAEQVAMDEVAAELVAKLNAAYAQMEPDDVISSAYPPDDAEAMEVETATPSTARAAKQSGRRRKPQPKEIPADALPKVQGGYLSSCAHCFSRSSRYP